MNTFPERLRAVRLDRGYSQNKLVSEMSAIFDCKPVSRTAVAQWEAGVIKDISATNLLKAAAVLEVNAFWLLYGTMTDNSDSYGKFGYDNANYGNAAYGKIQSVKSTKNSKKTKLPKNC